MKLVVMQPYFFPYLGYFDLLNLTDEWIVFDTPQYMRQGWVNRNRILHPKSGWQYILVPVKYRPVETPINLMEIADEDWTGRLVRQLLHYKKAAPYYRNVLAFLEECFEGLDTNLASINTTLFSKAARFLGIEKSIHVYSEMNLAVHGHMDLPGDLGVRIAQAVGASEFINRPGGVSLFNADNFSRHGIKLTFQSFTSMVYRCGKYQFEPDMSILDVMMWNSPEEIKQYLDNWRTNSPSTDKGK